MKTGLFKAIIPMSYVLFQDIVGEPNFPAAIPSSKLVLRKPFCRVDQPHLIIPPKDDELKFLMQSMPEMEAFLGQNFFMGRSWTIDYPNERIQVNTPLRNNSQDLAGVQRIGFKKNKKGVAIFGHPSMTIEVDGEVIPVLFDTGATIVYSDQDRENLATDELSTGGSFIAASVFDRWRTDHPNWKYIPGTYGDLIEVPLVTIGGNQVGPVLFSKRPDENWSKHMIHSMDKVVKGAIGGSALKYLKVTIDYNSELIRFEG